MKLTSPVFAKLISINFSYKVVLLNKIFEIFSEILYCRVFSGISIELIYPESVSENFAAVLLHFYRILFINMTTITIIGIAASLLTATSMMPQLIKILRDKEAESVSILMLAVLFSGLSLWIWYGILIDDIIIVVSNSFSAFVNVLTVIFSIKYKKEEDVL